MALSLVPVQELLHCRVKSVFLARVIAPEIFAAEVDGIFVVLLAQSVSRIVSVLLYHFDAKIGPAQVTRCDKGAAAAAEGVKDISPSCENASISGERTMTGFWVGCK